MAIIYQPLEIETEPGSGVGSGKWRMVRYSDEDSAVVPTGLCECEHGTAEEAVNCPEAKAKVDRAFLGPELYAPEREVSDDAEQRARQLLEMLGRNDEDLCSITTQVNVAQVIRDAEVDAVRVASEAYDQRLREYLDQAILRWRAARGSHRKGSSPHTVAGCYVDAYQSIRTALLGGVLP